MFNLAKRDTERGWDGSLYFCKRGWDGNEKEMGWRLSPPRPFPVQRGSEVYAGAGLVPGSDPSEEYEEISARLRFSPCHWVWFGGLDLSGGYLPHLAATGSKSQTNKTTNFGFPEIPSRGLKFRMFCEWHEWPSSVIRCSWEHIGCGSKIGTQNGTLVNGNMD